MAKPRLDENGWEQLDTTPVSIPAGFKKPETMEERIERIVRYKLSRDAHEQGLETFEESEDFNVDDDSFDPSTPYETFFDPQLGAEITPQEFAIHEETYRKRFMKAQTEYFDQVDRHGVMHENLRRARARRKKTMTPEQPASRSVGSQRPSGGRTETGGEGG